MREPVSLRPVETADLPILFIHQADPEAARLAAFPSRDWQAFQSHWTANILGHPAVLSYAILVRDRVVGNIGAWTDAAARTRLISYWIERESWGRGIASGAIAQLLRLEPTRPLHARVAQHNLGSIRVLAKAGFTCAGEEVFSLPDGTPSAELHYILHA